MEITTNRFGKLDIAQDAVIRFPKGLFGWEDCREWILLADEQNEALAWLQSLDRSEVALAVVSPRRFVPGFQMRVARRELSPLKLNDVSEAEVLVIVGKRDQGITLNLKAPVVINLEERLGRQIITNGDLPIQYPLGEQRPAMRRSA